jgi:hypothetical protein
VAQILRKMRVHLDLRRRKLVGNAFHVGAFDKAAGLAPTRHISPKERLPWLHLAEGPDH